MCSVLGCYTTCYYACTYCYCSAGQYSAPFGYVASSSSCTSCAAGQYQPNVAANSCYSCPGVRGRFRKIYCGENMIQRNVSCCFLSSFAPSRSGLLLSSGLKRLNCLSCGLLLPSGLRHLQCLSCGVLLPRLQCNLLDMSGRVSTALAFTCLRQSALLGLWDSD